MTQRVVDRDDEDLSISQAILKQLRFTSVDSGSDYHLLQLLRRVRIDQDHDELIAVLRERKDYARMPRYKVLTEEAIRSLERKKRAAMIKQADADFVSALGDDGDGENILPE